jgi:hypothetical protein
MFRSSHGRPISRRVDVYHSYDDSDGKKRTNKSRSVNPLLTWPRSCCCVRSACVYNDVFYRWFLLYARGDLPDLERSVLDGRKNGPSVAGVPVKQLRRAEAVLPRLRDGVNAFITEGGMCLIPSSTLDTCSQDVLEDNTAGLSDDCADIGHGQLHVITSHLVPATVTSQQHMYSYYKQMMEEYVEHQARAASLCANRADFVQFVARTIELMDIATADAEALQKKKRVSAKRFLSQAEKLRGRGKGYRSTKVNTHDASDSDTDELSASGRVAKPQLTPSHRLVRARGVSIDTRGPVMVDVIDPYAVDASSSSSATTSAASTPAASTSAASAASVSGSSSQTPLIGVVTPNSWQRRPIGHKAMQALGRL